MIRFPSRFLRPNDRYIDLDRGTLRGFLFFLGFGRSGHSIIGQTVNAHPNALVADEAAIFDDLGVEPDCNTTMKYLIEKDRSFALRWYHKDLPIQTRTELPLRWYPRGKGRNYLFVGLHQGMVKLPSVIGTSKAGYTARKIAEDPGMLSRFEASVSVPLKFVNVVRNPFDMIASGMRRRNSDFESICSGFELAADRLSAALDAVRDYPVFHIRQEDFIRDPKSGIQNLFDFLELPTSKKLKNIVASRLYDSPQKSRLKVSALESLENRRRVDALIARHEYFFGYSYES